MRPSRLTRAARIVLVIVAVCVPTAAHAGPPSPLSAVPDAADFALVVANPRHLLDAATTPTLFQQALKLAPVREVLEGTNARRARQLIAHVEREIGKATPEILDGVAGGGIVLASKFGAQPAPALLVIQGTDSAQSERFFGVLLALVEQEIARQGTPVQFARTPMPGGTLVALGGDAHLAQTGSTILFASKKEVLTASLDLLAGKSKKSLAQRPEFQAATKVIPAAPLAWIWIDMEAVRRAPETADFYKTPREPLLTVLFGGYVDTLSRTPFVAISLTRDREDFAVNVRAPAGRDGMGPDRALHVGPDGPASSRPLLEPAGALYSSSFYLDTAAFWNDRATLFGADVVKGLDQADKGLKQFPFSRVQLSKMLTAAGPYHRVVIANQKKTGYQQQPATAIPAYAVVTELRNADDFAEGVEVLARGGALLYATQVRMKMTEEKVGDVALLGWRFDESKAVPEDTAYSRFAYSPCFARVGNQIILSSTIELARELIPLVQKEKADQRSASVETRFLGAGFAELLGLQKDELITQAILDQAVPAAEARKQVADFIEILRKTGGLSLKATYGADRFDFEIRARLTGGK